MFSSVATTRGSTLVTLIIDTVLSSASRIPVLPGDLVMSPVSPTKLDPAEGQALLLVVMSL